MNHNVVRIKCGCLKTTQQKALGRETVLQQKSTANGRHSPLTCLVTMSEMLLIIRGKRGMAFLLEASFTLLVFPLPSLSAYKYQSYTFFSHTALEKVEFFKAESRQKCSSRNALRSTVCNSSKCSTENMDEVDYMSTVKQI